MSYRGQLFIHTVMFIKNCRFLT